MVVIGEKTRLFAGTSGWSYPSWKPGFYPPKLPARQFLEHYAGRLNSVEVNYTFRATLLSEQLAGWLAAAASGFRFSFKAPESITHRKRLRDCGEALDHFLLSIEPARAAGALGCLLFQLPPNFRADLPRLGAFLASPGLANAGRVAFEFRHESWFQDATWDLLRTHDVAVCIAKSETLQTPEVLTSRTFACYRLRLPGGYPPEVVADHAAKFHALAAARDVFVYYKHEEEPMGPLAAEAMLLQAAELTADQPD